MADFDLSQALDGTNEITSIRCETCYYDMKDGQKEMFRLEEGLDLVVSHNPKTLQRVAHLVLAVNRFKKPLNPSSWDVSSNELCRTIMDALVEERIVETIVNSTSQEKRFHRTTTTKECTLSDTSQKALICSLQGSQLQAITLKGGHCDRRVCFKVSAYIPNFKNKDEDLIVALSIKNHSLHMACSMVGDTAVLTLEECKEDSMGNITNDGNLDRFLFHKRASDFSLTMFESVQCPGWFISTSSEDENQPVEMCKLNTAFRLTRFKVNKK
ncbi:interleukin-1 beta [Channa argus]|uniref:interleukin-1 beta n=1 Tax=Channa argus TaxID=215402 RepID=UPI0035215846